MRLADGRGARRWLRAALLVAGLLAGTVALAADDDAAALRSGHELLSRSDAIRNPGRSFRVDVDLFEYRAGALVNSMGLQVFARAGKADERFGNIVRFRQPAQDVGKLMLFQGKDLWFYDPNSRASFRLSPQQRLIGQAANGDVLAVRLTTDYQARLQGRQTITDADRSPRECDHLLLQASTPEAVYARIEYWQDAATAQPVKAKFYGESGQLLKTAFYRKPVMQLGELRPSEVVIIDGLNAKLVTIMRYANYAYQDVPVAWMQRDYLPLFKVH